MLSHRNIIYISFFVPLHVFPFAFIAAHFSLCSFMMADWDEDDKKRDAKNGRLAFHLRLEAN
jgi:hypothetical protein